MELARPGKPLALQLMGDYRREPCEQWEFSPLLQSFIQTVSRWAKPFQARGGFCHTEQLFSHPRVQAAGGQ